MASVIVKKSQFHGAKKLNTKEPDALSAVVWAMAQFIGKQAAVAVSAMTDNGVALQAARS